MFDEQSHCLALRKWSKFHRARVLLRDVDSLLEDTHGMLRHATLLGILRFAGKPLINVVVLAVGEQSRVEAVEILSTSGELWA